MFYFLQNILHYCIVKNKYIVFIINPKILSLNKSEAKTITTVSSLPKHSLGTFIIDMWLGSEM